MTKRSFLGSHRILLAALAAIASGVTACSGPGASLPPSTGSEPPPSVKPTPTNPGQTDFTSEDQNGPGGI
ncbi:MAG TPA: hypothetical protein VFH73_00335, partial [Polyangia bacterium]|nr:hypothetical protein [Polyangia bacterium]